MPTPAFTLDPPANPAAKPPAPGQHRPPTPVQHSGSPTPHSPPPAGEMLSR
jgi:hypothetical protein